MTHSKLDVQRGSCKVRGMPKRHPLPTTIGGPKIIKIRHLLVAIVVGCLAAACSAESYRSTTAVAPPPVMREFRAAWIPTVANLCWPSKSGLTTAQQKAEMVALLDGAIELRLNAVVFQVRPACDALYKSNIEPWSEYLTGRQGQAPSPEYDPLEFAVAEAHKRGLELHAWFNPYRARDFGSTSPAAPSHISRTRPQLVRSYGTYLWLDPGERDVQDYTLRVVLDVVKRYDVDAVHFDDYFYPYPQKNSAGKTIEFPDEETWRKSGATAGLSRADWRRRNVDQFIQRVYTRVHAEKPWVKFGLSPFGIWRPKNPPGIEGLDAYDVLYADARKWLHEGWCDYMSPQLYWGIQPGRTSFPLLLDWWNEQNTKRRHLWPGMNSYGTLTGTASDSSPWPPGEITNQIALIRNAQSTPGGIHWREPVLTKNESLRTLLARSVYREPALVPAYKWLDGTPPTGPKVTATISNGTTRLNWQILPSGESAARWVVQSRQFSDWKTQILPGTASSLAFDLKPDFVAVTAVDRCGNASPPVVMQLAK